MSAINSDTGSTVPKSLPAQVSTGSMIDCRNVYKISPTKPVIPNAQQQDIVKIRITKDDSGNGFGYTKTIVSNTQSTEGKTDNRIAPQTININLAQQPTIQMKTPQNKIVFVKMMPKMPQNGPQVVAASASRSSISPTTLAVARSVQGLRPIAHVGSPPKSTIISDISTTPEKPKSTASKEIAKTESDTSLSSNSTLTTVTSSCSFTTTTSTESEIFNNQQTRSSSPPVDDKELDQSTEPNSQTMEENEQHDDPDDSASTGNVKMSREMRCLKASQSSSKILTEFMLNSSSSEKLRKRCRSRGEGEDSRSCGSLTPTSQKRYSVSGREDDMDIDESKGSPSSNAKRSGMRSANAEFSMKQKKFLSSIHHQSDGSDNSDNEGERSNAAATRSAKKGVEMPVPPQAPKLGWDKFCWRCKTCEPGLETCSGCIRCFHPVCLKMSPAFFVVEKKWNCPECIKADALADGASDKHAKDIKLKQDSLTVSLKFTMKRMQQLKGSSILNPLDRENFPNYDGYVTKHIDLTTLQNNIVEHKYQTTEAFQADVNWILHNASIYPLNSKLLSIAKSLMKICKQEINEIEACNECYFNANTCKTWFTEVCSKPHLLVWAKLKGFPYWPAKLMSVNVNQLADVRFFGDHDRAWVPIKECFLFCDKDPNTKLQRRTNMAECMREAETYISKLKKKFGSFKYAEFRTPLEPGKLDEHLEAMLPGVLQKIVENGDSQKAKLMLKIIKTADNFLSVSPVSPNPPKTSTPKARQRESMSPEKVKEIIFGSPKDKSTAESNSFEVPASKNRSQSTQVKEEIRNSISTPDPITSLAAKIYATRKRKSISASNDESKPKEVSPESASQEPRKKSNRIRSSLANKPKDEDGSSSTASEPAPVPKCYSGKKRKSSTPVVDVIKEPKQNKIESVVLQRESDSWKTVPSGKKAKLASESTESEGEKVETTKEVEKKEDPKPETSDSSVPKPDEKDQQEPPAAATSAPVEPEVASKVDEPPIPKSAEPPGTTNKLNLLPLIPLAADEIKTEPTEEEPPPPNESSVADHAVEPTTANTSNGSVTIATNANDSSSTNASLPLLPIKSEPVSDDESSVGTATTNQAPPQPAKQQTENPNPVLIRTSNRIMVRNINQLTNQTAPRANAVFNNNGQPVVLTPVDKSKVPQKITPKAPIIIHAKARKPPLMQTAAQSQPVAIKRTTTVPGPSGTNTFPAGRNSGSMMHMVHIPSPLPMAANDLAGRSDQPNGGSAVPQQQPSTTNTTPVSSNEPTGNNPTPNQSNPAPTPPMTSGEQPSSAAGGSAEGDHMMAGFITPSLAAAVTETIVSTPPKLHSRPSGALRSEGDCVYPSGAGPVSQILINNSYKMADFFRSVIEDTLSDLSNNSGALEAKVKVLELEIEKLKHCHQQEITKLKHNSDLVLCEMRKNMEVEKTRIINEVRKQCELERIRSVEEAKKKQWCVNCGKEALFYCCWNTSYCDYPCQQQHWATHMNHCTQSQFNLPSNAIASKPSTVINNKLTTQQHITTPKITTVQTLNLNGRAGLTIQPASQAQQLQQQQQQLIITSARGAAQLGKGQPYQRLMLNPASAGPPAYTIVSSSPNRWPPTGSLTASIGPVEPQIGSPTPVGILTSSSVVAAAVTGGVLGRPGSNIKPVAGEKFVVGAK
nr:protein kinase C-binding protein 1 isoform X1 [Aedes albopictus]XP_029733936.1 protein kinase C-binding protein 1 isoform X1 [Aedes albopictus]XP_029733940.1 protein kinase C-binding protein 1 isoform X1 [Aedes albopictus]